MMDITVEQMLNNITNDLDLLLAEFCDLPYPEQGEPPPTKNKPIRTHGGKPVMMCENQSGFGGSSTDGTLTSTDSNVSNKDINNGTLTSTDSNTSRPNSVTQSSPAQFDVFGLLQTKAVEGTVYGDRQPSPSRSTSGSNLRQITVLERLLKTSPIWYLSEVGRSGAVHLLKDRDVGIFIVRKSSREEIMALSVQFPREDGSPNVDHYLIEPVECGFHLQGSHRLFNEIPNLIAYYCENKEDLPHRLVLPPAVQNAKTSQELAALSMLGQDFWISSKYDMQSRSSSRTNLSEHSLSSAMNKSQSEPINISQVAPYSQSDALLQNGAVPAPKNPVIDFSSYIIQKNETMSSVMTSEQVNFSRVKAVNSMRDGNSSSVTEITQAVSHTNTERHCSHVTHGHVTGGHVTHGHVTGGHVTHGHVTTGCDSCHRQREESRQHGQNMVLHVKPTENRVDIEILSRRDSQVSVPYAKPNKGSNITRSSSYGGELLHPGTLPEDEYYFRSNLSDKMSDYEDIWKNNYADPKSVQSDIVQRLYPNMVNCQRNVAAVTAGNCDGQETFAEHWHTEHCVVKDLNVSLDKLNISKESSSTTDVTMATSSSECRTVTALDSAAVMSDSFKKVKKEVKKDSTEQCVSMPLQHNSRQSESGENTPPLYTERSRHSSAAGFHTIHELESDLDTDSNHSNGSHSDNEADTEDCDCQPSNSVQTQTSPLWKLKSPPFKGTRKSVSTSSLCTMKTPVYSEPFDAIAQGRANRNVPKVTKKRRRQSAPVLGMVKTRHPSSECNKLTPMFGEEARHSAEEDETRALTAESDHNKSDDIEDVFELSLELKQPLKGSKTEKVSSFEAEWVESSVFTSRQTTSHVTRTDKPKAVPRKHQKTIPAWLVQTAVANDRNRKEACVIKPSHIPVNNVIDSQIFEDFDENQNLSSPTCGKFPVLSAPVTGNDDPNHSHYYGTAEDIIALSNPELTLRPFPTCGPHSEYDNLNGPYVAPSGQSMYSAGTVFQQPWEHGMVAKIMDIPHKNFQLHVPMTPPPLGPAPPPLPTLDPTERIKLWQQSSQKYAPCVPLEIEDGCSSSVRRCVTPDLLAIQPTSLETEKSSHYDDFQLQVATTSPEQQSKTEVDGTGVNETRTDQSTTGTEKQNTSMLGTDFREKIAPILANPRLLHQLSRNRNPDRVIREYIINLSKDRNTTFGSTIENFIQCTQESQDTNPHNITRNVRQFMNGIKNYLVKHGEGELEDLIERERNQLGQDEILNIDAIIESALHVCVIQPLKQYIYTLFVNEYSKNGNLRLLMGNIKYARTKTAEEIGIRKELTPPDGPTLDLIKHYFARMQKSYSPLKKLEHLLSATSSIYKCVASNHQGNNSSPPVFGADDFLPMLIYVLVQCSTLAVEIEADYMWGLLHPSLLTGEGGYYLTSLSSAVLVLKNFKEMQETKATQQQGKLPSISDMQGFLKIAIPDEQRDTIVWPTLPVRPSMTTRDVCSIIAHKFKITNPQDFGLYTLDNGEEHKLMDMECPQSLKADRMLRKKECIFVYKRNAANIAWPKSVQ